MAFLTTRSGCNSHSVRRLSGLRRPCVPNSTHARRYVLADHHSALSLLAVGRETACKKVATLHHARALVLQWQARLLPLTDSHALKLWFASGRAFRSRLRRSAVDMQRLLVANAGGLSCARCFLPLASVRMSRQGACEGVGPSNLYVRHLHR